MGEPVILLAEDDPVVRDLATRVLRRERFVVLPAGSGEEALALSRNRRIDLLVTDVQMDGCLNGIELAERVVGDQPAAKVLIISGYPESGSAAAERGFPFLGKPFTPLTLTERVRELLGSVSRPPSKGPG